MRDSLQKEVDACGILSLCAKNDDILMWSHYASSHRGICLEFKAGDNDPFFAYALPVTYPDADDRPK